MAFNSYTDPAIQVNKKDEDRRIPFDLAACNGDTESVEGILWQGATVHRRPFQHRNTGTRGVFSGGWPLVAKVNTLNWYDPGQNALQAAAEHGHEAIVQRLLTSGTDINAFGPLRWGDIVRDLA